MVELLLFISKKKQLRNCQVVFSVTDDTDTIQQLDEEDDAA